MATERKTYKNLLSSLISICNALFEVISFFKEHSKYKLNFPIYFYAAYLTDFIWLEDKYI